MSNDNLLDKLRKNRQRSVVQRNDTLLSFEQKEVVNDLAQDNPEPKPDENNSNNLAVTLEELKSQLAKFPNTRRRSAIVLDEDIDRELSTFCKDRRITVETFLEAAWIVSSDDRDLLDRILALAKLRYAERKEAGQLRRLITQLSNENR